MAKPAYSIAVFPFLKTSAPVQLGAYTFRSTNDLQGLSEDQAQDVRDIGKMLFVQDNFQVLSATYAITPYMGSATVGPIIETLREVRDVLSFVYAAPDPRGGHLYLSPEQCSVVAFSRDRVPRLLVEPDYHTKRVPNQRIKKGRPDDFIEGFTGLYNLENAFWCVPGSRLYPPIPHIGLNEAQDLHHLMMHSLPASDYMPALVRLLSAVDHPFRQKIFTSMRWFNYANARGRHEDAALLNLAVAFEALLQLPESAKTDRC